MECVVGSRSLMVIAGDPELKSLMKLSTCSRRVNGVVGAVH